MSIFTKPLSQVTWSDVNDLMTERAVENVRLEFKREVPGRDETLKKLSSFANTYGGYVVVGAEANSKDGRLVALPGVGSQPNYKQTVVQWCVDGATPFLDVDVSDPILLPSGSPSVCYVIFTAESDLAPHFLNGRKGVYVRTNEFSSRFEARLANETELRHLFDRRKLVRDRRAALIQRARRRFRTFVDTRYKELAQGQEKIGCRFDLSVVPRYPSQPICEHSNLNALVAAKQVRWRSVGFPRRSVGFISQHESTIGLRPGSSFSIFEANIWGLLFYASEIEHHRPNYSGIHLNHFLGQLLVFLEHARMLLQDIGYVGPLLVELRLESMRGVPWIFFDDADVATSGPASELDDEVLIETLSSREELERTPDKLAMNLLRYIFFAMNWADEADTEEKLERLIRVGYTYNSWPKPTKLRV